MANIKSQIKRIKTNEKARLRNRFVKQTLKTYVKKVRKAIKDGEKEVAQANYKEAARQLDKAVSKGVIHKKQAANRKSALQNAINAM